MITYTLNIIRHSTKRQRRRRSLALTHSASEVTTLWRDKKCKVFPYSLPSVGPGADPGVQAVSPQVT